MTLNDRQGRVIYCEMLQVLPAENSPSPESVTKVAGATLSIPHTELTTKLIHYT